ncbi:hypothetical protein PLESTB_000784300 [Pleodorina starrii]|uniref:RING-type E3 ubiquitin transferase n=1 Tax=Pleodorina starrii TaxID=330485 RepID=A0A9W6F2Z4_9CHLO|nr:hypothetical protein PLESTM_000500600 [Pleodorina starrii]GLC53761.1 hypothetical protein PLESTB_000784300 [Pleodorina starrii]GLC72941.1 hypothetical protein PLESTF_001311900 [Pleodorina starrii]
MISGSGNAGHVATGARRELGDSVLTVYVAGSITAITLASATYLWYLRHQRVAMEPGTHAERPSTRLRGLLDGLLGRLHLLPVAPAAAAPAAQPGQADANRHRWLATDAAPAPDTAGNRPDQLDPTGDFFPEDVARREALAPGPQGVPAPLGMEEDGVVGFAGADADEDVDDDAAGGVAWRDLLDDVEDELEVPDEFKDPISLNVMLDPVVLCATGQVYDYTTLKDWFRTGNRLCPKTNIEVLDVQVVRLPWLKARIYDWLKQQGRAPTPKPDAEERLARLHPTISGWVHSVRNDTGEKRSAALADLYELLRQWEAASLEPPEGSEAAAGRPCGSAAYAAANERLHRYVRGAVMDETIWLLRHGNPYLQGVAASILAYCDSAGEVSWLAAVAAVPAVSLCMSQNRYTSQAATRLLYNLARGGQVARRALVGAGAVTALISVLATDRQEYGYCRDRAAATLALLIRDADGKSLLLRYGLPHLVAMVLSGLDRWEQRDAATVLLKLGLGPDQLHDLGLTPDQLVSYWCCSRAWLEGLVELPDQGYVPAEKQARQAVQQLQAGTLTHAALAGFIAAQDADLDLTNLDLNADSDDPWAENAHPSEEAALAWRLVEAAAQRQLNAEAESSLAERQAAEERRRRDSAAAGLAAAVAAAALPGGGGEAGDDGQDRVGGNAEADADDDGESEAGPDDGAEEREKGAGAEEAEVDVGEARAAEEEAVDAERRYEYNGDEDGGEGGEDGAGGQAAAHE